MNNIKKGYCFQFDNYKSIYIVEDLQYNDYMIPTMIYYKNFSYNQIINKDNYILFIKDKNIISDRLSSYDWNIISDVNKCIFLGKINQDLAFDKNWNLTTNKKYFIHFLKLVY